METLIPIATLVIPLLVLQIILIRSIARVSRHPKTEYWVNLKHITARAFVLTAISTTMIVIIGSSVLSMPNGGIAVVSVLMIEIVLQVIFIFLASRPETLNNFAKNFSGINLFYFGSLVYILPPLTLLDQWSYL